MHRRPMLMFAAAAWLVPLAARAHHGWSSFDQSKPLYVEGRARKVVWRNPHAELDLEIRQPLLAVPVDLAQRTLPAQSATIDGPGLLAKVQVPKRKDPVWHVELAPLTRMEAWKVPEIQPGSELAVIGYTHEGEQGEAVLRAEFLLIGDKTYGLRSSPA